MPLQHDECPLKSRVKDAWAFIGSHEFAVVLLPRPAKKPSLPHYALLSLNPGLKPDDLLQDLTQNDIVRPTFEIEHMAGSFPKFHHLLRGKAFRDADIANKFGLTTELLKDMQKRLQNTQSGASAALSGDLTERPVPILDCSFAALDSTRPSIIQYTRFTLHAIKPPVGRSNKAKNSVGLHASWERRRFCTRSDASISDLYVKHPSGDWPHAKSVREGAVLQGPCLAFQSGSPNVSTEALSPPPCEGLPEPPENRRGVKRTSVDAERARVSVHQGDSTSESTSLPEAPGIMASGGHQRSSPNVLETANLEGSASTSAVDSAAIADQGVVAAPRTGPNCTPMAALSISQVVAAEAVYLQLKNHRQGGEEPRAPPLDSPHPSRTVPPPSTVSLQDTRSSSLGSRGRTPTSPRRVGVTATGLSHGQSAFNLKAAIRASQRLRHGVAEPGGGHHRSQSPKYSNNY